MVFCFVFIYCCYLVFYGICKSEKFSKTENIAEICVFLDLGGSRDIQRFLLPLYSII